MSKASVNAESKGLEKLCTKCGERKPASEFSKNLRHKSGLRSQCKSCDSRDHYRRKSVQGLTFPGKGIRREPITVNCLMCGRDFTVETVALPERCLECRKLHKAEYSKSYRLLRTYGLSQGDIGMMLEAQSYKCAMCFVSLEDDFEVDHDHSCCPPVDPRKYCGGCNRGLICRRCNFFLGFLEKDQDLLVLAVTYLEKTGTKMPTVNIERRG